MPVAVALLASGAWLIYASVTGQPIGASITAAFTGRPRPAPERLASSVPSGAGGAAGTGGNTPSMSTSTSAGTAPALVSLGQGSHRLTPAAAIAFHAWERRYGATIPITDSYRSYAVQAAQHAKDPKRFVSPESSAHPRGTAVDVDMARTNQPKLIEAATATGWCQAAVKKGEPWHFSYGECR